jgi:DNA-binding response OmpR family regulator
MQEPPGETTGGFESFVSASAPERMDAVAQTVSFAAAVSHRILVVEDDAPLARLIAKGLATEAYSVDLAHDGETALAMLGRAAHDLVILDLNLPKMDGLALLQWLRASQSSTQVLVLTGRSRTEDRVQTLDGGADDCLLKPFSLLELMARVRVLLRRAKGSFSAADRTTVSVPLVLDRGEFRAARNGRSIQLTPREFTVLEYLLAHVGKPLSRATLMQEVWNMPLETNTNIVDVYMKYLRDKIDGDGEEKLIHTVRGVGYVLRAG